MQRKPNGDIAIFVDKKLVAGSLLMVEITSVLCFLYLIYAIVYEKFNYHFLLMSLIIFIGAPFIVLKLLPKIRSNEPEILLTSNGIYYYDGFLRKQFITWDKIKHISSVYKNPTGLDKDRDIVITLKSNNNSVIVRENKEEVITINTHFLSKEMKRNLVDVINEKYQEVKKW